MYPKHKAMLRAWFFLIAVGSFILKLEYAVIASDAINVIAVASAVYFAVYAGIQGSDKMQEVLKQTDHIRKDETQLGVINSYLKAALVIGVLTILFSILFRVLDERFFTATTQSLTTGGILITNETSKLCQIVERLLSALGMGMLSISFATMWMIGKFMVNRIAFNK